MTESLNQDPNDNIAVSTQLMMENKENETNVDIENTGGEDITPLTINESATGEQLNPTEEVQPIPTASPQSVPNLLDTSVPIMMGYVVDVTQPPPGSLSRESVVKPLSERLNSKNVILDRQIVGSKKLAENIRNEQCIRKTILIEHNNKIYKIEGYELQRDLLELFRDPSKYETVGNFVLTSLLNEVVKLEKLHQDLLTTTSLWESTFITEKNPMTEEKRDRQQDLEVVSKILRYVGELSNDLTTYVHEIEEDIRQKKDR